VHARNTHRHTQHTLTLCSPLQVGDRFWALFHNAAQIYGMRVSIVEFMTERQYYCRGILKKENNLTKTIRAIGANDLPEGPFKVKQQLRVVSEVRAVCAWNFGLMGPMLLIASRMVNINGSAEFCQAGQEFFIKMVKCPEFASKLITKHNIPFTFATGKNFTFDRELSTTQQVAYERMCEPTCTNAQTIELLRIGAAHMIKCQVNMSADLILAQSVRRDFKAKRADNIAAERFFATWDSFKRRFARNENDLRTNGRTVWKLNDVAAWLRTKTPAEQDRLIKLVSSVRFRAVLMQQEKDRKEAETACRKERMDKAVAKGKAMAEKCASKLHNQDMWPVGEVSPASEREREREREQGQEREQEKEGGRKEGREREQESPGGIEPPISTN
jgi:hypothetical protein